MRARSTSTKIYVGVSICECCLVRRAYLALGHCPQRLDDGQLCLEVWCVVQEAHNGLNHLSGGLFKLSMLLREQQDLLIHKIPVIRLLSYCDDGDDDTRGGREI
jgi:hypothetical protein